jgi:hypothetical protein
VQPFLFKNLGADAVMFGYLQTTFSVRPRPITHAWTSRANAPAWWTEKGFLEQSKKR